MFGKFNLNVFIYSTEHVYAVGIHQETGQNQTEKRSKTTTKTEDTLFRISKLNDKTLTAPDITARLNRCHKKDVNIHCGKTIL